MSAAVADQLAQLSAGLEQLYGGSQALSSGIAQLNAGAGQLQAGEGDLVAGIGRLDTGGGALTGKYRQGETGRAEGPGGPVFQAENNAPRTATLTLRRVMRRGATREAAWTTAREELAQKRTFVRLSRSKTPSHAD